MVENLSQLTSCTTRKIRLLQSLKDRQGIKGLTKKQVSITVNRNNKIRDYLNKAARYLINLCRENKISTIVVGVNPGM
ncbi:MAG: transposase, partial [Okeania sp. SIO2D1]|nr:transposase [Okeania sp. SIO2D1]